jgi:hypothetical protein
MTAHLQVILFKGVASEKLLSKKGGGEGKTHTMKTSMAGT